MNNKQYTGQNMTVDLSDFVRFGQILSVGFHAISLAYGPW